MGALETNGEETVTRAVPMSSPGHISVLISTIFKRQLESSTRQKVTRRVAAVTVSLLKWWSQYFERRFYLWKCLRLHHISKNSTFPWACVKTRRPGFRTSSEEFTKYWKMIGGCQSYTFFPSAKMDVESLASEFCAQAYYQLTSQIWRRKGSSICDPTHRLWCLCFPSPHPLLLTS